MDYAARMQKLQKAIAARGLDALLLGLTGPQAAAYLTGAQVMVLMLLVSPTEHVAFAASTEYDEVAERYPQLPLKFMTRFSLREIVEQLRAWGVKRLGFEAGASYAAYMGLRQALPEIELIPAGDLVEGMQRIKDAEEIALMLRASAINDAAMEQIKASLKPGVSEREIAIQAEHLLKQGGADHIEFLLVQFGSNSALCHYTPRERRLKPGDLVLLDWGPVYQGYASDVTRTWVLGEPTAKQREIHALVRRAQESALAAVRPGKLAKEIDAVAREIITAAGFGKAFHHRLGHGMNVGPDLNPASEERLEAGMAFSIEPGVYLPGWGGVRVENTVVVTPTGGEAMDRITKELLVL
jgi:Xaa-Pro aminopeptidase